MKSAVLAIAQISVAAGQRIREWVARSRLVLVLVLIPLLLTSCVEYDVGINFESQTHGEIVQHIQLGERLKAFSSSTADAWLDSIERRTRQLRGRIKRISDREIAVTIPFNNGDELVEKFNQFFNPGDRSQSPAARSPEGELPQIASVMSLTQKNFLLAIYNQMSYDLDLRSLGVISTNGNVLVSPGALLDLEFALNTPWGAQTIPIAPEALAPEIRKEGRQLLWKLQPGQLNHIEARFWVPSPIGIGALLITLLVAVGIGLKTVLLPALGIGQRKPTTPKKPQAETGNVAS